VSQIENPTSLRVRHSQTDQMGGFYNTLFWILAIENVPSRMFLPGGACHRHANR
jgi:hypothetical protein